MQRELGVQTPIEHKKICLKRKFWASIILKDVKACLSFSLLQFLLVKNGLCVWVFHFTYWEICCNTIRYI